MRKTKKAWLQLMIYVKRMRKKFRLLLVGAKCNVSTHGERLRAQVPYKPADQYEENKVHTLVKLPLFYYRFKFNVSIQTDLLQEEDLKR